MENTDIQKFHKCAPNGKDIEISSREVKREGETMKKKVKNNLKNHES